MPALYVRRVRTILLITHIKTHKNREELAVLAQSTRTDSLHGVPLFYKELCSGDIYVHSQGLLLVQRV